MKKGKRDQRQYDLVQQHLPGLILSTILRIVEDLGDPYRAKPGLGGMTAYPPKAMAVVCILMEAEARTYRKMVGHLRMNRSLAMKIGLPKIPSKSTIWRAYGMIPESYLREVHTRIIGDVMVTGSVAGDSTGYSSNRFVRWFSIRHDQVRLKRGWVKLHSIVDVSTRTVLDYLVTRVFARCWGGSKRALVSSAWIRPTFRRSATPYPTRTWYRASGPNPTPSARTGAEAWGDMTRTHRDELALMDEYHQRSIIEAVFGAIKRMYGNHLRSRTAANLLQHRGGRTIGKKRQAHARVAHCNGS